MGVPSHLSYTTMVSIIAKKMGIKRQYNALCEVFDRADITRDGTISIAEYMALCDEYGVLLDEADIKEIGNIADNDGEIHRLDFILHVKNSHLLKHFETVDPLSRIHWKKKADLAFRIFDLNKDGYVDKKEFKWMTTNSKIDHEKVDLLFERMDLNGNGKLDYEEFTSLIFKQKERKMANSMIKRKYSKPKMNSTKHRKESRERTSSKKTD